MNQSEVSVPRSRWNKRWPFLEAAPVAVFHSVLRPLWQKDSDLDETLQYHSQALKVLEVDLRSFRLGGNQKLCCLHAGGLIHWNRQGARIFRPHGAIPSPIQVNLGRRRFAYRGAAA
jgi:hypothetical protein